MLSRPIRLALSVVAATVFSGSACGGSLSDELGIGSGDQAGCYSNDAFALRDIAEEELEAIVAQAGSALGLQLTLPSRGDALVVSAGKISSRRGDGLAVQYNYSDPASPSVSYYFTPLPFCWWFLDPSGAVTDTVEGISVKRWDFAPTKSELRGQLAQFESAGVHVEVRVYWFSSLHAAPAHDEQVALLRQWVASVITANNWPPSVQ